MKILLATALPHHPQGRGGSQSSTHELAKLLQSQGHEAGVACGLWRGGLVPIRSRLNMLLRNSAVSKETLSGYKVFRTACVPTAANLIATEFRPDVVAVQGLDPVGVGRAFSILGIPIVFCIRDTEINHLGGDLTPFGSSLFVANSRYTSKWLCDNFRISSVVIPPPINRESYQVSTTRRNVTFINPIAIKGVEMALAVADLLPEIPFCFVESWVLEKKALQSLRDSIRSRPNIKLFRRTDNMKMVYRNAKIMLVPSQWHEAWGRIASEAQVSGIPVVASNIGGLPEAVGPGGVLLDPKAPPQEWANAIKRLWTDDQYYSCLSAAALEYSLREELDKEKQAMIWQTVIEDAYALRGQEVSDSAPEARRVQEP